VTVSAGFILLYRQITEWEWYQNPNTFRVFLHILLKANFTDGRFEGREIKRGQLVTSLDHLSKETKLSVKEVRTALNHLIWTGELASESCNRYRVITVVKYNEYQSEGKQNGKQWASEGQSDGKQGASEGQQYNNDNNGIREQFKNVYQDGFMDDADAKEIQSEHDQLLEAAKNAGFRCTPSENATLISLYAEHGMEKMLAGFQACIDNSAPKLSYLKACLSGKPKEKPQAKPKVLHAQNFPQRNYEDVNDQMMNDLDAEVLRFLATGEVS
jgi:hypothetical protein